MTDAHLVLSILTIINPHESRSKPARELGHMDD